MTVVLSTGTGNVEIAVERPDRDEAVRAANAVAEMVVQRTASDALAAAEVASAAVPSRATPKPPRRLMIAVGCVASGLLGVAVWVVWTGRLRVRGRVAAHLEPTGPSPEPVTAVHVPTPARGGDV